MNKILLITCFILNVITCNAQITRVEYYDVRGKQVPQEQARFERTIIQNGDGSTTTQEKNLKTGRVNSETVQEPFGTLSGWAGALDYNFKIEYAQDKCSNGELLPELTNYFEDVDSLVYVAAKLPGNENINRFIARNLNYPNYAKENNLQGRITAKFIIGKDSSISNIAVVEGVNVVLDKEFVRVLRKLKFSSPPKINGRPVDLCVTALCVFRLG